MDGFATLSQKVVKVRNVFGHGQDLSIDLIADSQHIGGTD